MLTKFENRSNRVKGLAFHPKRPWILASLHSGAVQLWDYRMEILVDKFEEHEGPVRGIDFHPTQPLFVSGGDDWKIKVWNYSLRRCLYNLLGHLDYIRTVQFHHEYPWIVSASDDQTIRIWNWQSRQCLSVLTGHSHYVMCAQFHPKEDLILSASLDQTCRVWDFTGLRKKNVSIGGNMLQNQQNADLFGGSEVNVRVLEGHSRGVNWASFHRTNPLIVSGADDREVKLWRMNDSKVWEVDTMRGHTNNVSCVIFHPKKDLIVSNSEDKSVRIWDMTKQQPPQTWRRENDRFWILAAHPNLNLLAAGHDSGMVVFKLERERPAMDVSKSLFYYKDRYIRMYDFKSKRDVPVVATRRPGSAAANNVPRTLLYNSMNPAEHNILLCSTVEGGSYELFTFNKTDTVHDDVQSSLRGLGLAAVFTSRNRFAVLDNTNQISLKNLANETKRKIKLPVNFVNYLFPATIGHILLRAPDALYLFDMQSRTVVNKLVTLARHPIKYVCWSKNHRYVALMSKFLVYICDSQLNEMCMINETSRIKSAGWDPAGVLVYTTASHIKYCLTNGDNGIIRTLDVPIYITSVNGNSLSCLDRELKIRELHLDNTEYMFKLALLHRRYVDVLKIIQTNKLVGKSIIAYLHKKGFPEVALHFVQDPKTKFSLALECGNIKIALECAKELNNNECWHKLGVEALRQGNHQIVEMAYQKTKNFERLSFLYLITGNIEKLSKMLHIAQLRNDLMGRFHNALYLGNVEERINVLRDSGQLKLAYLTAKLHQCEEQMKEIEELLEEIPELPEDLNAGLMSPPTPILREDNWPMIEVSKDIFEDTESMIAASAPALVEEPEQEVDVHGWDAGVQLDDEDREEKKGGEERVEAGGWDVNLNLDLPEVAGEEEAKQEIVGSGSDYFVLPTLGQTAAQKWAESSNVPAVLVAAGQFDMAMHLLHSQAGVVNFQPLKPLFLAIAQAAHVSLPMLPSLPSLKSALFASHQPDLPVLALNFSQCVERLKAAYKSVTDGKFSQAHQQFLSLLQTVPLLTVESKSQAREIQELLQICREYITAMRLELARREEADAVRQFELAIYFTKCDLQPIHTFLGLRVAIKCGYTIKNFKTTALLCRRLLELCVASKLPPNLVQSTDQIKGVLKACEKTNTDAENVRYEERAFSICCDSLVPVYRNQPSINCPFCNSVYVAAADGKLCDTCQLSRVGLQADGLQILKDK